MTDSPVHPIKPRPMNMPHSTKTMTLDTVERASSASTMVVRFRHPWAYRLAWVLVLAAHVGVVFAYNHEAYINTYILLGSKTEMAVQLLGLGASIRHAIGVTLVTTNRILMAWHIFAAAQIVVSSLWYRTLVFRRPRNLKPIKRLGKALVPSSPSLPPPPPPLLRVGTLARIHSVLERGSQFYRSTGARGKHFDTAFEVRETIEIISQTVQAYHISCLITNVSVLHFVALVLVLNCWSTPLIHLLGSTQEAKRRALCLAIDAVFDFCCALAIPFLTFSLWEYQVATLDFFDAVWLIRSSTLLQYNLVNTWAGVITTRLPALGLIFALETLKTLLCRHERMPGVSRSSTALAAFKCSPTCVPDAPAIAASVSKGQAVTAVAVAVPAKHASRAGFVFQLVFFVYGFVILILYTKAMAEPTVDQDVTSNCLLQLRPWGRSNAQCAVLDIDCARLGISGTSEEITHVLDTYDASVLASVTIANCPSLEMPSTIKRLRRMLHLEVYNSTITAWDSTAALTRDSHPVLTGLFLVRTSNLARGLPAGLLSPRFPPSLCVMVLVCSDLHELTMVTEDTEMIQTTWPATMFVLAIEQTKLREFPRVLLTKTITQTLSLSGNDLSTVPSEAFLSAAPATALWLTANPLTALPATPPIANAHKQSPVRQIYLSDTQIQEMPAWFTTLYNASPSPSPSPPLVSAYGTPLCADAAAVHPSMIDCKPRGQNAYFPLVAYEAKRRARVGG